MKIGITLNEVIRDFIGQFEYTYDKYIGKSEIKEGDVTSFELEKYFPFPSKDELNKFLYSEASLEIFGHADQLHENIMSLFNIFLMDIEDEEEHEIILISREAIKSIPATLFFLSKLGCRAKNYKWVSKHEDKWGDVDILITANPEALKSKPEGKISIKVNASYNKGVESDFEINTIMDFMDESTRGKILNSKIITNKLIN